MVKPRTKYNQTQEYRDMLKRRAYFRLAADTLLTALNHWFIYHSDDGRAVRFASANVRTNGWGRVESGEWARLGVSRQLLARNNLRDIATGKDPIGFLCSSTIYHEACEVDPETFRIVLADPDRARDLQARLNKHRKSAKKSPPEPKSEGARVAV